MTKAEFKKSLTKSIEYDWFKNKQIVLTLPLINFNKTFNGISDFYDFIRDQFDGWNTLTENLPTELNVSKNYFKQVNEQIIALVSSQINSSSNELENYWNNYILPLLNRNITKTLTYNCTETELLIDIFNKEPNYYNGAYNYIIGNVSNINSDKNTFIGASIANDFFKKEAIFKFSRKDTEQKSFEKLKKELQAKIDESSSTVTEHLKNVNDDYKKYVESLEDLKTEKDLSFQEWFTTSKETFEKFDTASNLKFKELESLFREQLILEAPAAYWETRAKELKIEGQKWLNYLMICSGIGIALLFSLLIIIASNEYEEIFKFSGKTIRWSIILITMISFIAFLIKTFTKLTFSTFHLVRDAEERKQLSFVYLALKENGAVADIDRQIILQSIFSRADTGLLKEDSSPTMPTSIIEKVVNSGK